ncbi:methyl-accepting chemotaxis protein [Dryocola sp. BD613]|uniref:methyl-accepting chemotaxis protein n=1 Tax=Dryocola sp. BD613 TaxID=3133272 RepID=UPI003F4FB709
MLKNIKIITGLSVVLVLLCILQLVSSGLSYTALKQDKENLEMLEILRMRRAAVNDAFISLLQAQNDISTARAVFEARVGTDVIQEDTRKRLDLASNSLKAADKYWNEFDNLPHLLTDFPAEDLKRDYLQAYQGMTETIAALQANDLAAAKKHHMQAYMDNLEARFTAYRESIGNSYSIVVSDTNKAFSTSTTVLFSILALVLCVNLIIWRGMKAALIAPMHKIIDGIRHIADGDLLHNIEVHSSNEMGQLADTLRHMQRELTNTVGNVRISADAIFTGASEISAGNNDLSSRTEQQAASLEETAASMEQLTATVKQNAENASQASQLAQNASETAQRGGKVVDNVVHTMSDIATSSQKIADITSVIDGIAFQTNILALNAAVEAARAGEQGRGFAVVASEVRNLAQRSAQAAREIKMLIDDSVSKVGTGSALVESAGETMGEIVRSITSVTDIMSEIASASDEQSRGIDQIGVAVSEMDRVTQQNATLVEESAAAATALEAQARGLTEAVAVFRLNQSDVVEKQARAATVKPKAKKPVVTASRPAKADANENWETF